MNKIKQTIMNHVVNNRWDYYSLLLALINCLAIDFNNAWITAIVVLLDVRLFMHVFEKVTYIVNQMRDYNDF